MAILDALAHSKQRTRISTIEERTDAFQARMKRGEKSKQCNRVKLTIIDLNVETPE